MNEQEARQRVQALKHFYVHLLTYAVVMAFLSTVNFLSYSEEEGIWVIYPLLSWGLFVLLHGLAAYLGSGGAKRWEENKVRELTGWSATREELARLSERVETLLQIVSDERDTELHPDLVETRQTLIAARDAISRQRSPLDAGDENEMRKREVVELVQRLEALLTQERFKQFDDALGRAEGGDGAARH